MLYDFQKEIIAINPDYSGLWLPCGLGKSLIAIRIINQKPIKKCLIICPKTLKTNWLNELEMWNINLDQEFEIISKEEFKKEVKEKSIGVNEGIIVDEAHNQAGYTSQLFKNTIKYFKAIKPKAIYLLTGTPYLSTPFNVMCYERMLGLNTNWKQYNEEFFNCVRMGKRMIPVFDQSKMPILVERLKAIGITRSKEECIDLPDKIFTSEYFSFTKSQERKQKQIEDELINIAHIVLWTKIHQLCGCGVLNERREPEFVDSDKVNRVMEYAEQYDKFIIVCRYNHELGLLKQKLEAKGYTVGLLNGKTKERQALIDRAEASDKFIFLINNAVSEGYNLISFNLMLFFSHSFSYKDYAQIQDRVHRIGQKNKCTYIELVLKGSIDEDILANLKNKEDFNIQLYKKV